MKSRYLKSLLLLLMSIAINPIYAKAPENLSLAKQSVVNYYESNAYENDVDVIVKDAERYLEKRVRENSTSNNPQRLAMVLDIDDTTLTNFPGYKKKDFAHLQEVIDEGFYDANAPAIKPVMRLYNEAIRSGVAVFFVTLRPEKVRTYTIANLHEAGYFGWSGLFMPNGNETKLSPQRYKTAIRERLTKQNYHIILNLGDQDTDLIGGYAEHIHKLPNPLYSITSDASPAGKSAR